MILFDNTVAQTTQSTKTTTMINPELIEQSLLNLQDYLERSSITYVVLGDVSKQLKDRNDALIETDKIEVAVLRRYYTESGASMLKQILVNSDYVDNIEYITVDDKVKNIIYKYKNEVPVVIRILDKNWSFLQNPDTVFYRLSEFPLPNPFNKYWDTRTLVK